MSQLIYNVDDKPAFKPLIISALQQLLAIIAGTIAVPMIIGLPEMTSSAILGCGLGTLAYLLITKKKSPIILSSNFAFISSLLVAKEYGYLGIILGGFFSGIVYVIFSIIIHFVGTKWIDKVLPKVVIGPVVALIGLTLAGNAVSDLTTSQSYVLESKNAYNLLALFCGLVTFITVVVCSIQKKFKTAKLVPFLIGIVFGYLIASLFSIIGYATNNNYFKIIDFSPLINNFKNISFTSFLNYPHFSLIKAIQEISEKRVLLNGLGVAKIALAFIPISLVSFSEHIADHKNLSSIVGFDILENPGLEKTLMGDGIGNIVGTTFGICPNTTYSQCIGCVAISKNASTNVTLLTAILCIGLSFFSPLIALVQTIPSCVMGGICLALYGFIAASGLKMLQGIEIGEGKNLFTVSVILVAGVGSLVLQIPTKYVDNAGTSIVLEMVEVGGIAFSLILGMITYLIGNYIEKKNEKYNDDNKEENMK